MQPLLFAVNMYHVSQGEQDKLNILFFKGLAIQTVAEIHPGGRITRDQGVLKDWDLPEFPES